MKKKLADCTIGEIRNKCIKTNCKRCELFGANGCVLLAEAAQDWVKIDENTYDAITIEELAVEI